MPTETAPHVVGAILTFAGTGLGWLMFSRRMSADGQWRGLSTYTMATSIAMLTPQKRRFSSTSHKVLTER